MSQLTAAELRERRKANRCPDCRSKVKVRRDGGGVRVYHDDTCPMYARLKASGQTSSMLLVRPDDMSAAEFTSRVNRAAAEIAAETGVRLRINDGPYAGVGW